MRSKQVIRKGVAQANTGQTDYVTSPPWATQARFDLSVITVVGTTPLTDFVLDYAFVKPTAAVVVATTVAGGAANEQQTITLTGGPTHGEFLVNWGGVGANVTVVTEPISAVASARDMQNAIDNALADDASPTYRPGDILVTRSGAGTSGDPYVFTLEFKQTVALTDVDAVTVTDKGLHTYVLSGLGIGNGWNGVTQIVATTAADVSTWVCPNRGLADDDTGPVYFLNTPLPNVVACKTTFDRTTGDETYTYQLSVEFYS